MKITSFESAVFYEYNRCKDNKDITFPLKIIVIDADDYSIGFCTCTKKGDVKIVSSKNLTGDKTCIQDIDDVFCKNLKVYKNICDLDDESIETFNKRMKFYYKSEKIMNEDFEDIGLNLKCDEFENLFHCVKNKFSELLSSFSDICESNNFNKDDYKIIIIGKAASFYPVKYYIKSILAFDAFLPDSRFLNENYSVAEDEIVAIGEKAYIDKRNREQEIYISLINMVSQNKEKIKIPFIETQSEDKEDMFLGPIFISKDDKLAFEINSKENLCELKDPLKISDVIAVEVGLFLKDDKYFIRVRKYKKPDRFFDLEAI